MHKPSTSHLVDHRHYFECKTLQEKLQFLLKFAELAPSRLNTRPWKFKVTDSQIRIYLDFSRRLDHIDPYNREMYISIGCVLANLEIAAEYYGLYYSTCIFTNEPLHGLLCTIDFSLYREPKYVYPGALFHSIWKRHVNRQEFPADKIHSEDMQDLGNSVRWIEDISLYLTDDEYTRDYLSQITFESEEEQFGSNAFRRELSSWIKTDPDAAGLLISDLNISPISALFYSLFKSYNFGEDKAYLDRMLIQKSPLIGVLSSRDDTPSDWISVGVAFQVICLAAVSMGIAFHPMTSGIEVPYFRAKIQDITESEYVPQMLIRFGYESRTPPSTTI